jgi:ribosome maturation factor RimP
MIEGRRKFEGVIQSAADNVVTIEIEDGSKIELPFDEIDMARLVPVFEKQAKR